MATMTLEQIMNESLWVVKMQGWRQVGTYAEVKDMADDEECRDFDLAAEQPESVKPFFDAYFKYCETNGWITIPDYYKDIYLVDIQEQKPAKRVWTEEEIRELIQTNDKVLYGAIRKLYAEQTADEQRAQSTTHRNGAGFNSIDAKFMTSIAQFLNRTGFLTDKQKACARKKLVKYNKQLTKLANAS